MMIGVSYGNFQGPNGMLDISVSEPKCNNKKDGTFSITNNEPISVLDTRSPSPSTSTSTLSSSFGGGVTGGGLSGGSTDNVAGLAVVSDSNTKQKWLGSLPPETKQEKIVVSDEAAVAGKFGGKEEWEVELQPIVGGSEMGLKGFDKSGLGLEDWESLLSDSGQDPAFFRWISGEVDDPSFSLKQLLHNGDLNNAFADQSFGFEALAPNTLESSNNLGNAENPTFCDSFGMNFQQLYPNLQVFNPQMMISQPQVEGSSLLNPFLNGTQQEKEQQFHPQPKRQNSGVSYSSSQTPKIPIFDPGHEFFLRKQQNLAQIQQPQMGFGQLVNLPPQHFQHNPFIVPKQEMGSGGGGGGGVQMVASQANHHQPPQQVTYDQLYKAAELMLAGNVTHAQAILARLNHQLSPTGKSFQRAAFYFKEALQLPLVMPNPASSMRPKVPTPFDAMFKMGAYKVFSEISPLIQFLNFTSNQALLEALDDADHIHIIDFDVGFGAQWSSFMQELPRRKIGAPSLKITAFACPSTHHPIEIALMHENLTQFANDIGIKFELEVVNFESFDPNTYPMPTSQSSKNEAIAVNFPIWSISSHPSVLSSVLRFIKKLSPKIVVSSDHGCERTELPFSHHFLHALQYYEVLLDSIDAANVTSDIANKIERFLFLPRIESLVLGRLQAPGKMHPWKSLFASAGFSPVGFSNFAESQAEYVLNRTQVPGFRVEKHQGLLVLCWNRRELVSASAWRC